jgi:hypothetical protein
MIILASLFGGLALAIYPGWAIIGAWIAAKGDAPSWIQAVGSIAAIVAATIIASNQSRQTHRQETERYRRQMDALSGVFDRAWSLAREILVNVDEPNNAYYYVNEHHSAKDVEDVLVELQKIDVTRLGSAGAVEAMLDLRASVSKAKGIAESIGSYDHDDLERIDWDEFRDTCRTILRQADTSRELLNRLAQAS